MAAAYPLGARPPLIGDSEQPSPLSASNPVRPPLSGDTTIASSLPLPHPPVAAPARLPPPGPSPLFPLQAAMARPGPAPQAAVAGNPSRSQFPPQGLPTTFPGAVMPPPQAFNRMLSPVHQTRPPLHPPSQQTGEESGVGAGGGGGKRGTEVWFEHKLPDGRVYFSHSQTQKTTWDRPQNVEIVPHPTQQVSTPGPTPTSLPTPIPRPTVPVPHPSPGPVLAGLPPPHRPPPMLPRMPPPFPLSLHRMPGAPQLVPTRVWSEHTTPEGKTYYYNKVTRASVWEKPKDYDLVMPLPAELTAPGFAPRVQAQPQRMIIEPSVPPRQPFPLPHTQPLPISRPPLIATPPVGTRLPITTHPLTPPILTPPQLPIRPTGTVGDATATTTAGKGENKMEEDVEEVEMKAEGNTEHIESPTLVTAANTQDGTAETPPDLSFSTPSTINLPPNPIITTSTSTTLPTHTITSPLQQNEVTSEVGGVAHGHVILPPAFVVTEQAPPPKEEPKGPRPIASIPVPGTPWSVVWTTDERIFFFDVTSRVSLWIMPEELKENPQAVRIVEGGPLGSKRVGEVKEEEPAVKRPRLEEEEEGEGEGEGEGEAEEEMEVVGGGELIVPEARASVVDMKSRLSEAAEMERKLAMLKAGKTLEDRQTEFKEMLLERGVSAFSTWDKELPKFVFDPRYMLLSNKERKACFEDFIRSRAEEERKEKRNKLKVKRDEFRILLEDSKLHSKSMFSEFAMRHGKDERFKAVEKMREREQLFSEYLQELKRASKHKAEGHSHSSSKQDKTKSDFLEMLSENHLLSESTHWRKVKSSFERDARYRAVSSSSLKEEWFRDHVKSLGNKPSDPGKEREDRIQASLKEREREVKMSRTAHEKEWGRERDQLRKTEAAQQFKGLLVDVVRSTDTAWHDARRQLRQDQRWQLAELLESGDRERMFQEHLEGLAEKKRVHFRKLLEETSQISLVMPWKKARKLIKEDPRYKNYGDSDHRREAEYDKFLRDKMVTAKNEFRALLRETKIITYKSHNLIQESQRHRKEIIDILKNDKRYLVLNCIPEERDLILQDYLLGLHQKGPPPPPTATNPAERLRKT